MKENNAEGIMRAAAGRDIFSICPDQALAEFEQAGKMGNAIAAYDAAMMRIERGNEADRKAAVLLMSQAAKLGDKKADDMRRTMK